MNSYTQVLILFISFVYGIFFSLLSKYNAYLIKKLSNITKYLITLIFIMDIVIIYIYLIYILNKGVFHIYFLLLIAAGFIITSINYPKIVKLCQKMKNKKRSL